MKKFIFSVLLSLSLLFVPLINDNVYASNLYESLDLVQIDSETVICTGDIVETSLVSAVELKFKTTSVFCSIPYKCFYGSSAQKTYFIRFYYDENLLFDTYNGEITNYQNGGENAEFFKNQIKSISIIKSSYVAGFSIQFNNSISELINRWLPQNISIGFYALNGNLTAMDYVISFGSYIDYNHYDLDSYNAGYLNGFEKGKTETIDSMGDSLNDSYMQGYEDGYNLGYAAGVANTIIENYDFILDYNYTVLKLEQFTDSINVKDCLGGYMLVGINFELSMNYPVRDIDSFSVYLNSVSSGVFDESDYDGDTMVDGAIYCYNPKLNGSMSIPYDLTDSKLHYAIRDYQYFSYNILEMFGFDTDVLKLDNLILDGEKCTSYNDFIDYNINHYYGDDLSKITSSSSNQNQLTFYFIMYSVDILNDNFDFNSFIERISLNVKFNDGTTHYVQSANWFPSLFKSDNAFLNFKNGYNLGYNVGYNLGERVGLTDSELLKDTIFAVIDSPFKMLKNVLNFELLGINLWKLITGLISMILFIFLFKLFL